MSDNNTHDTQPLWPPFSERERIEAHDVHTPQPEDTAFAKTANIFTWLIIITVGAGMFGLLGLALQFARSAWGW